MNQFLSQTDAENESCRWCLVYSQLTYSPVLVRCSYSHLEESSNVMMWRINPNSVKMTFFSMPTMVCLFYHFIMILPKHIGVSCSLTSLISASLMN